MIVAESTRPTSFWLSAVTSILLPAHLVPQFGLATGRYPEYNPKRGSAITLFAVAQMVMNPLRTLKQCLIDTELVRLRIIARLWGLEVKASRPIAIAAELAQALAEPTHAAEIWETLSDDERLALTTLLDEEGMMPAAAFTRRFGEIRPIGPGRLERETPWRDPTGPTEALWYRGLIFQGFAEEAGETYPILFMPLELQAALPVETEAKNAAIRLEPTTPPSYPRVGGDLFLDDITTILAFVHNEVVRPRPGAAWDWPKRPRHTIVRWLRDPGAERLAFMLHLIDHLGWMRTGDDGRLRLVPKVVTTWLQETTHNQQAVLVSAWREMTEWNELWQLTNLQPEDTGTWHHDPTLARAALLRHLAALASDEWFGIADFVDAIKATDPDFQRPGGDYETWYIRDAASGTYLTGFDSWYQVDGVLLWALITGPAWWLGLVDLGPAAEGDALNLFCPKPTLAPAVKIEPPPSVLHADLTVAIPAARRFERFQLARVADLVKADDPYVYRLTPASLNRARQQRIDGQKVLTFLDGLSAASLPDAIRAALARWAERGTEVWLEKAVLLRVTDETVLSQILAAPEAARYVHRVVGPTAAVVAERDWPDMAAALAELGLMAQLVGLGDASVPPDP